MLLCLHKDIWVCVKIPLPGADGYRPLCNGPCFRPSVTGSVTDGLLTSVTALFLGSVTALFLGSVTAYTRKPLWVHQQRAETLSCAIGAPPSGQTRRTVTDPVSNTEKQLLLHTSVTGAFAGSVTDVPPGPVTYPRVLRRAQMQSQPSVKVVSTS